jgi:hypothetical protein
MTARRQLSTALAVGLFGGALAIGFLLNPAAVPSVGDEPQQLLQDPSFEQPTTLGTWNVRPVGAATPETVFRVIDTSAARDLRRVGRLTQGSIGQEVLLTPVRGRAYRFSVWLRSAPPGTEAQGSITAQTACASGEEVASTPFVAGADWLEVSSTVQPIDGEQCTMRVVVRSTAGTVDLDDASYVDAGLVNPSFELGNGIESWAIDAGASVTTDRSGAVDGRQFLRVVASASGGGIRQDTPIDPSSQPLLATASALVRSSGAPVRVQVTYREPCSDVIHRTEITTSRQWQRVTVRQPRLPGNAVPPTLIKVDGVPCAGQMGVVAAEPGAFDVDGAALTLQSYWPPEGDPSYQRATKRRTGVLPSSATRSTDS